MAESPQTQKTSVTSRISSLPLSDGTPAPVVQASLGSPASHQPIQLSDLQNILATMNVPAMAGAQGASGESRMAFAAEYIDMMSLTPPPTPPPLCSGPGQRLHSGDDGSHPEQR